MNALSQAKHRAWLKMVRAKKGPAQIRQALGALVTTLLDAAKKQAASEKDVRKGPSKGAEWCDADMTAYYAAVDEVMSATLTLLVAIDAHNGGHNADFYQNATYRGAKIEVLSLEAAINAYYEADTTLHATKIMHYYYNPSSPGASVKRGKPQDIRYVVEFLDVLPKECVPGWRGSVPEVSSRG